ncbi:MAG: dihydrolipoyl dehydrogenase [Alphaproteobacteria bacterium]
MSTRKVDIAIIGTGTAGMRAYHEAAKVTDSIAILEGDAYGTTCARVGCMPSKLLIAAADAAHSGARADIFGIHFGKPDIDGAAVMERVRQERDRFVGYVLDAIENWPEAHRVKAAARFVSDHELALSNGDSIVAERIVIATGSRPNVLPMFEDFGDRLVTSDDVFEWEDLPDSVAVFGAGVVGLELGQALHRLGVRMTLFGKDDLVGPLSDPDVLETARAIFREDFEFYPDADVTRCARTDDGVEVEFDGGGGSESRSFEVALIATGRRPNVDDLGLENTSLERDEQGVPFYDLHNGRCGGSHIFIAGDANNRLPLLHEAADEGFVSGYNAGHYSEMRRFSKSSAITVIFTDPQIMMVGESHRELTSRRADFEAAGLEWSDQGRARVIAAGEGLLRVYGERNSGRFLGAEMIGPRAEHLAHLLAWAHQSQLTVSQMIERPFYHPCLEEGVRTALRDLNYALDMGPRPPPRCIDCGPGG